MAVPKTKKPKRAEPPPEDEGLIARFAREYVQDHAEQQRVRDARARHDPDHSSLISRFVDDRPESPEETQSRVLEESDRVQRLMLRRELADARTAQHDRAAERARPDHSQGTRPETDDELANLIEAYGLPGVRHMTGTPEDRRRAMEIEANIAQQGERDFNTLDPEMEAAFRRAHTAASAINHLENRRRRTRYDRVAEVPLRETSGQDDPRNRQKMEMHLARFEQEAPSEEVRARAGEIETGAEDFLSEPGTFSIEETRPDAPPKLIDLETSQEQQRRALRNLRRTEAYEL